MAPPLTVPRCIGSSRKRRVKIRASPNPSNEQKKQLGKLMTEPQPSQLISQPVFFPGPMHEWQPLFRVGDPGTVAPASAGMFIPGRTYRDLKRRTAVRCQVSYHIVAADFRRLERHDNVTFPTLPESEVVRKA